MGEETETASRPRGMAPRFPPKVFRYVAELRAPFFSASVLPVVVAAAWVREREGIWDWGLFGWLVAGVLFVHAGANVANDYFDHRSGADACNRDYVRPFTGGSRLIQMGWLTPREVLGLALACLAAGIAVGLYLAWRVGLPVLWMGLIGVLGGFLYTAPPLRLVARGAGEFTVGVCFGVLPVLGAVYVLTGRMQAASLWLALPLAVLATAILFINQFPDCEADAAAGKRHWVVRLGRGRAVSVYAALMTIWPAPLVAGVAMGIAPPGVLLALAGLAPVGPAVRRAARHFDRPKSLAPAIAMTIATHWLVGALMAVGLLIAARVKPPLL
jgi:1,4-dihydroxy-2-naphthoate octaprenyltransferase